MTIQMEMKQSKLDNRYRYENITYECKLLLLY